MQTSEILDEIVRAFDHLEKPAPDRLVPLPFGSIEAAEISKELAEMPNEVSDADLVRTVHRYLCVLSPEAIRWILPTYLKFCVLTAESDTIRKEAASLIFFLSPAEPFKEAARFRLSALTSAELKCIVHFLEWCQADTYWDDDELSRIGDAITFVKAFGESLGA